MVDVHCLLQIGAKSPMPAEHRLRPREMVTGNVLVGSFAVNRGATWFSLPYMLKTYLMCTRNLFPRLEISIQFNSKSGTYERTLVTNSIHVFFYTNGPTTCSCLMSLLPRSLNLKCCKMVERSLVHFVRNMCKARSVMFYFLEILH